LGSTCSCALLVQALVKVLYDMMHQLAYSTPAQKPQMPYSDIGLPITDLHMLRIEFMSVIQKCLTSQTERLAFGAQTLPLCANWLVTLASSGMRSYAEGQDVMAGRKGLSNLAVGYSDVVGKHFLECRQHSCSYLRRYDVLQSCRAVCIGSCIVCVLNL